MEVKNGESVTGVNCACLLSGDVISGFVVETACELHKHWAFHYIAEFLKEKHAKGVFAKR